MTCTRLWTADEDMHLAVLAEQNLSIDEIAEILDRSDRAVELRLERTMPTVKVASAPTAKCDALADKAIRDASAKFAVQGLAMLRRLTLGGAVA